MVPRDEWYKQLQRLIETILDLARVICIAVVLLWAYLVMRVKGF